MRIATFNCNSVRTRQEAILGWLATHKPDLLALQETKVTDDLFPLEPFTRAGYAVSFRGMKAYNGVALLSRQAPDEVRYGLDDGGPADEPRLLHARLGTLHVLNTYVPQGRALAHPMFAYKLDWYQRLRAYCDRHFTARQRVVWLGDLNVAAEPIDVHNPEAREEHVCFHPEVRRAFAHSREWGFTDIFRKFHPGPGHYSFFDYRTQWRGKTGDGWRLDYILASPPLERTAQACWIDVEPRRGPRPSDHCFVAADFDG